MSVTDAQGKAGYIALAIITALAFFTRFYKLDHPNQVVFDEVHFGKFASYVHALLFPLRNSSAGNRNASGARSALSLLLDGAFPCLHLRENLSAC